MNSKKSELGTYSLEMLVKPVAQKITNKTYDAQAANYEPLVLRLSGFYYNLWVRGDDRLNAVSKEDLEQACRKKLYDLCKKGNPKIDMRNYVASAMRNGIIGEIRHMKRKIGKTYLTEQNNEQVPLVDLLPTTDNIHEQTDSMDELFYNIKQEFSPEDADNLKALVDKCDEAHLVNLSKPPVTRKKDQLKIVTAMDLNDADMLIYATALLSGGFKSGPHTEYPENKILTPERGAKYINFVLKQIGIEPEKFATEYMNKKEILKRYGLLGVLDGDSACGNITKLLEYVAPDVDVYKICGKRSIPETDGNARGNHLLNAWNSIEWIRRKNHRTPTEIRKHHFSKSLGGLLKYTFRGHSKLAIEFRYPGTYPEHAEEAVKLREELAEYIKNPKP